MPRPTRLLALRAPAAGLMSFSSMRSVLDLHQVAHLVDHSADRRRVGELDRVLAMAQPQSLHRGLVLGYGAAKALCQGHFDAFFFRHFPLHQAISSTFLPRLAAIS